MTGYLRLASNPGGEHLVIKRLPVGSRQRSKLSGDVLVEIRPIWVGVIDRIVDQRRKDSAIGAAQAESGRTIGRRVRFEKELRVARQLRTVPARLVRDALNFIRRRGLERGGVHVPLERALLVGHEIDQAATLVHAEQGPRRLQSPSIPRQ
jgi:hypothetical protein